MKKDILAKDLIKIYNAEIINGKEDLVLKNFNKDTRTIKSGEIYLGIKGKNFDGNKFIKEALEKGASACIIDNKEFLNFDLKNHTIIYVKDTVKALGELAKYKRNLYDIPVIGVTGSVGKTSTKDIISSVLSKKYKVLKTEGNYNNEIGLPLTILKLEDHNALVLEMGMSDFKEIEYLSNIANPTTAVITNVGTAHIANLGSRENILKAKLEITSGLKKEGNLIINNDNDLLNKYKSKINANVITVGIENECDYKAINIKDCNNGISFDIVYNDKITNLFTPINDKAYIYNSLMAFVIGLKYNINLEQIKKGIKDFKLSKSRLEKHIKNNITIIDDTYNASIDSIKSSLNYLENQKGKRRIAVLGDVLETGKFAKEIHTKLGKYIKTNSKIDNLYTIGEDSIYIYNEVKNSNILKTKHFKTIEEATKYLLKELKKDDVILLKASHGMNFYKIVTDLLDKI